MYYISVAKIFVFNIALGFLVGGGSFLFLLTLSYSPRGALIASLPLSLALNMAIVGFSLCSDRDHPPHDVNRFSL
jgi:hypothetical protein